MRWHLSVGVERKPAQTGTAGSRQCGAFPFRAKARTSTPNFLSGPPPKDDALFNRSGHGASELGFFTDTTHCRVGTQGMTRSTRSASAKQKTWAAVWAIRRPAHDGQNPRHLQLKARSTSFLQVAHPRRRKP